MSLKSFIYSLVELLAFTEENSIVQQIYHYAQTVYPTVKCGAPYAQTIHPMTKYGGPYAQTIYPMTKCRAPYAQTIYPMTKCGGPYAQTIYPMAKRRGPYAVSRNLETSNTLWLKSLFTKRGTPDLQTLETIE